MARKQFTGEDLAKMQPKIKILDDDPLKRLWRRVVRPDKIFFIRLPDGHGIILMADNEEDACLEAVPHLMEDNEHYMSCKNRDRCEACRAAFSELAEKLNRASITWLGWAAPDYNMAIST